MKKFNLTENAKATAAQLLEDVELGEEITVTCKCESKSCGKNHTLVGRVAHFDEDGCYLLGVDVDNRGKVDSQGAHITPEGKVLPIEKFQFSPASVMVIGIGELMDMAGRNTKIKA